MATYDTRSLDDLPKPEVRAVRWYALYVAPTKECRIAWDLIDRGYQVYVPTFRVTHKPRYAPKPVEITRVAFPSYIFLGVKPRQSWWEAKTVDGAISVVAQGYTPLVLSSADIEDMMAAQDMGLFSRQLTLRIGERVTLTAGAFEGYEAIVSRVPKRAAGDVVVQLDAHTIKLPLAMIKRIAAY